MGTYSYWQDKVDLKNTLQDEELAQLVNATFDRIVDEQAWLDEDMRRFTKLYLDREITGFIPGEYIPLIDDDDVDDDTADGSEARKIIAWNVVKGCVDTAVGKVMLQPAAPWFQTENGIVKAARIARKAELYCRTILHRKDVHHANRRAMKAAAVYPFGCTKTYAWVPRKNAGWQIDIDYVHPAYVHWDNQTTLSSKVPPTLYHVAYFLRRDLQARWPKFKNQIGEAPEASPTGPFGGRDMVRVIDAYDVPVGDRDGCRVIAINGQVLRKQRWDYPKPPFEFVHWQDDLLGELGISGTSDLEGIQEELRNTLRMIKRNKTQYGDPAYYNDKENKLAWADLADNAPFKVLEGSGPTPPQLLVTPFVAHQMVDWAALVKESGYQEFGLSQMAAAGEKPAGLRSGKALLTFHDIGNERLADVHKQHQQLVVGESEQIMRVSADIHKGDGVDYKVRARRRRGWSYIKFSDFKELDDYEITIHPGSSLPHSPAGRAEFLGLRMQEGLVSREEARQLLDWNDLKKFDRLANASREQLMDQFERMIETEEYEPPDPHQDLGMIDPQSGQYVEGLGHTLAKQYYLRGKVDGVPDETLALLDRWMEDAQAMIEEAFEAANPPQPEPTPLPAGLPAGPEAAAQLADATAALQPPAQPPAPPMPGMEG